MSDLYIDALGIAEEVKALRATLPRGKRSKILDEDFHATLSPMHEEESARVITAMRQATSSKHILEKLLQRVAMTDEVSVHKACVKLHGFVVLAGVLEEWSDDEGVVSLSLQCLAKWPLLARDKVVDSGIDAQVRRIADGEGATKSLATSLLDAWERLETTFRIARRAQDAEDAANGAEGSASWAARRRAEAEAAHRAAHAPDTVSSNLRALLSYRDGDETPSSAATPKPPPKVEAAPAPAPVPSISIDDIIRRANEENEAQQRKAAEEAAAAAAAAEAAAAAKEQAAKRRREKDPSEKRMEKKPKKAEPDLGALEKQLAKLVGALVVKQLSKVKQDLDREKFKRHAKEVRHSTHPVDAHSRQQGEAQPQVVAATRRAQGAQRGKAAKDEDFCARVHQKAAPAQAARQRGGRLDRGHRRDGRVVCRHLDGRIARRRVDGRRRHDRRRRL